MLERDGFFFMNFGPLSSKDLVEIASSVGPTLHIPYVGEIFSVEPLDGSRYASLSYDAVPLHNEAVYLRKPPSHVLLYCERPSDEGGECILTRGDDIVRRMGGELRSHLARLPVKIELGGLSVTRLLLVKHPSARMEVLFFMDPLVSRDCRLSLDESLLEEIRRELYDESTIVTHPWRRHDILILDNFRVLHGRRAFRGGRSVKRIMIRRTRLRAGR
jgi:alpha-ketoglutarate-dependent taurine dioxygenase